MSTGWQAVLIVVGWWASLMWFFNLGKLAGQTSFLRMMREVLAEFGKDSKEHTIDYGLGRLDFCDAIIDRIEGIKNKRG